MTTHARWRLVLGKFAERQLGGLDANARRQDEALEFLYGREYEGRGLRKQAAPGTLDPSALVAVTWLQRLRELFPGSTAETIEKHALDRYGLTELVTDAKTLQRLEPNQALLRTLLGLRRHLDGEVLAVARQIIRQVTEEIRRRLEPEVRRVLSGRLNRQRHSPLAATQNFDVRGTIRHNLKHFDRERGQLVVDRLRFFERHQRHLPWDIILCVDQSGSMADSVIHSAVMAGILCKLPALRVRIVLFDTSIVDLTDQVDDPVEVLLGVQLGGGTDIAQAVRYCAQRIDNPHRSIFVLISDFCEGGPPGNLVQAITALAESRVRMLGLASLDDTSEPVYDRQMAERLAACGMTIAALTPQRFAQWLVSVIS
ncbi:VWA domain-containing protein [Tahibacter amnicola]|uniref:VWA domain-containing protein n=1 Tax=Tahibacter amnicola TaxID=2976241 RepID=A0ABY6BAA0_9GAMM|nr:VWA domain-containing protein [Tahibacter amnicola]UXI66979.1 VWA domain-containing protein [Tahibacter amnicola]